MTRRSDIQWSDAAAVTASDTADNIFAGLYIGAAGDVTVVTAAGNTVLFKAVPVGTIIPINVIKVKSTGTASTSITGLLP